MGFLRILLAISVIIQHSGNWLWKIQLVGGFLAVEIFFLFSGFYMALVLDQKYKSISQIKVFLQNRFLRIFPAYWIITLIFLLLMPMFRQGQVWNESSYLLLRDWDGFPLWTKLWLGLTHLVIFGQDISIFIGVDPSSGALILKKFGLHLYYPNGVSWTLALELLFYVMAPFIVHNKRATFWVFFLSLSLRAAMDILGVQFEPYILRFFPTQLCVFFLGVIIYQQRNFLLLRSRNSRIAVLALSVLALFTYHYWSEIERGDIAFKIILMLGIGAAIPSIFELTKNSKLDRYLGKLSYLIYISHFLVHELLSMFIKDLNLFCLATILSSVIVAILLLHTVDIPLENLRERLFRKSLSGPQ